MKKKTCMVCGKKLFDEAVVCLYNLPASAQDLPSLNELQTDKGFDLELFQCSGCGLIQLDCEPVKYFRDVIRSCGYNDTIRGYRFEQYSRFIGMFSLQGKKIIEAGCGQGEFLDLFNAFNVDAAGLENNALLVEKARANGLRVYLGFSGGEATNIEGAPYDAFVSFNYLEHLPDPNAYLGCISRSLNDGGYGLITVPSFEYIVEEGRWYELIRDHLAYYTKESICFCLQINGFDIIDCSRSNEDSLLLTVKKREKLEAESVTGGCSKLREQLNEYIESNMRFGGKTAVWGASHQCFTLLAAMDMAKKIEYIIDSAPFKQGRYSPAAHIPIVSPEELRSHPVEAIIIIAPAYVHEIERIIRTQFGDKVKIAAILKNRLEIL